MKTRGKRGGLSLNQTRMIPVRITTYAKKKMQIMPGNQVTKPNNTKNLNNSVYILHESESASITDGTDSKVGPNRRSTWETCEIPTRLTSRTRIIDNSNKNKRETDIQTHRQYTGKRNSIRSFQNLIHIPLPRNVTEPTIMRSTNHESALIPKSATHKK